MENDSMAEILETVRQNSDAAIVMESGSADELIESFLKQGWSLQEKVDLIGGKRIRYLVKQEDQRE